ncbi:uncharacterized protein LOC141910009 isoform X2 [Tubulanus polymorphus]
MKLLLAVLVFAALSSAVLSCSCGGRSLKHHFCTSKYVVEAEILTKKQSPGNINQANIVYTLDVKKYYKPTDGMESNPVKFISTAAAGSLCGVTYLEEGETHILFVYMYKNAPRIGICSSPRGVKEDDIKDIDCSTTTDMDHHIKDTIEIIDFDKQLVNP